MELLEIYLFRGTYSVPTGDVAFRFESFDLTQNSFRFLYNLQGREISFQRPSRPAAGSAAEICSLSFFLRLL